MEEMQMKNITDGIEETSENQVIKSVFILVSHVRSASYVLVIVTVYLISWTPFFAFCTFTSLDQGHKEPSDGEPPCNISSDNVTL